MFQIDRKLVLRFLIGYGITTLLSLISLFVNTKTFVIVYLTFSILYVFIYFLSYYMLYKYNKMNKDKLKTYEDGDLIHLTIKDFNDLKMKGVFERDGTFYIDEERKKWIENNLKVSKQ